MNAVQKMICLVLFTMCLSSLALAEIQVTDWGRGTWSNGVRVPGSENIGQMQVAYFSSDRVNQNNVAVCPLFEYMDDAGNWRIAPLKYANQKDLYPLNATTSIVYMSPGEHVYFETEPVIPTGIRDVRVNVFWWDGSTWQNDYPWNHQAE